MDWSNLAGQFAQIGLPALGTLFGGPLGGTIGTIVGKAVAGALGVAPTPEAVSTAIANDPSVASTKLAEIEAETRRQQNQLEDLANARALETVAIQTNHPVAWVPVFFSFLNYVILVGVIACIAMGWLREDGIIVGFALGAATAAYQYWLGSSDGSKRNGDTMRQVASVATQAASKAAITRR